MGDDEVQEGDLQVLKEVALSYELLETLFKLGRSYIRYILLSILLLLLCYRIKLLDKFYKFFMPGSFGIEENTEDRVFEL